MKHPLLVAEKRTVLGKEVKKLRRTGLVPANVYGKHLESTAIQVKDKEFDKVFKEVGETGLIDLEIDGSAKPVLVKNLQMNYQFDTPLHVDFYQVNLKEKVKTMVPLVLVGESPAVTDEIGTLLQTLSEVEVEALPDKLPEHIEVPIEHLAAVDEHILVSDLKAPADVAILTDPSQTIVKIAEPVVEEVPEEEVAAEGEEGTAAEGEATTEGENKEGEEAKSEEATENKEE